MNWIEPIAKSIHCSMLYALLFPHYFSWYIYFHARAASTLKRRFWRNRNLCAAHTNGKTFNLSNMPKEAIELRAHNATLRLSCSRLRNIHNDGKRVGAANSGWENSETPSPAARSELISTKHPTATLLYVFSFNLIVYYLHNSFSLSLALAGVLYCFRKQQQTITFGVHS